MQKIKIRFKMLDVAGKERDKCIPGQYNVVKSVNTHSAFAILLCWQTNIKIYLFLTVWDNCLNVLYYTFLLI